MIVDEAHLKRKKLLEVIDNLTRNTATKVIGLSGTPFAKFLGNYYQRLIKPTTMKELIAIGALSKYEFYAPSHPDLSKVETSYVAGYGSDYKENQLSQLMSEAKLVGDIVKTGWRTAKTARRFVFASMSPTPILSRLNLPALA